MTKPTMFVASYPCKKGVALKNEKLISELREYIETLEKRSELLGEIIATLRINLARHEFDAMPAIQPWREMVDDWAKKSIKLNTEGAS